MYVHTHTHICTPTGFIETAGVASQGKMQDVMCTFSHGTDVVATRAL